MILEIFMFKRKYFVEYYTKDLTREDAELSGPYSFPVKTKTIEEAVVKAAEKFITICLSSGQKSILWNAKIKNPKGEDYKILKEGDWLVNFNTGEKFSKLEKKVGEKQ